MTILKDLKAAWPLHKDAASRAASAFDEMCSSPLPPVVLPTKARIALRIYYGRTEAEAASREYIYRWSLALTSSSFGVPHALGL